MIPISPTNADQLRITMFSSVPWNEVPNIDSSAAYGAKAHRTLSMSGLLRAALSTLYF
jgi:hypothetical protein